MKIKRKNMYITIFPVYGLAFGVNYWDTEMQPDDEKPEGKEYMIQVLLGIFGISFHWWRD